MLSSEEVIRFCERTNLLSRKPDKSALSEAIKLDTDFALFLGEAFRSGMNFTSCEDFLQCYRSYSSGINGNRYS